ncbi:MAG: hypothetical protein KAU17_16320 [Spirochaetales bacterium]|nr:hypothetical protein [Spirochaetales bacterium]
MMLSGSSALIPAVFLLSLSCLSFEVLLTRFFSIAQWNHLSFLVLGIALFGFSASGVFLSVTHQRNRRLVPYIAAHSQLLIVGFCITALTSYLICNALPIDFFRIPFDWRQLIFLVLTFLLFSIPFVFTGALTSVAYMVESRKAGKIYFASMTGSAFGALLPLLLLPVMGTGGGLICSGMLPVFLLFTSRDKRFLTTGGILILLTACMMVSAGPELFTVSPSPYKSLPQILLYPESRVIRSSETLEGKTDLIDSSAIRFAPGLSLSYRGNLPRQTALLLDGDQKLVLYEISDDSLSDFPLYSLSNAGYLIAGERGDLTKGKILLAGMDGGSSVLHALLTHCESLYFAEDNPEIRKIIESHYQGRSIADSGDTVRSTAARHPHFFDLIHLQNWGSSLPGMESLSQNHHLTVEAIQSYLSSMTERGILILTRRLQLPPSDSLVSFGTAFKALASLGIKSPGQHIIMIRNWDTYTIVLSQKRYSVSEINLIRDFCGTLGFDTMFFPGIREEDANRINIFQEPYHYRAIAAYTETLKAGDSNFQKDYLLNVTPREDDSPFFTSYIRIGRLKELYQATGSRPYSILLSGEILLWILLIVSFLLSTLLLAVPVVVSKIKPVRWLQVLYFLSLGAGFMFVETAFIREFTLATGSPVRSFTLVLFIMLIASGFGGYFSGKLKDKHLLPVMLVLTIILFVLFLSIRTLTGFSLTLPPGIRELFLGSLLIPPAFLLGVPFPLGMRSFPVSPGGRAYFWAANGCTSVLASVFSLFIAMNLGISWLLLFAAGAYCVALLVIRK